MTNGTTDYKLGQLTQGFEDMRKDFSSYKTRNFKEHKVLRDELRTLNIWRWKIIGAVSLLAIIGNLAWDIVKDKIF